MRFFLGGASGGIFGRPGSWCHISLRYSIHEGLAGTATDVRHFTPLPPHLEYYDSTTPTWAKWSKNFERSIGTKPALENSDGPTKQHPAEKGRLKMKPEVTQANCLDMQVCVPGDWTDDQAVEFANRENECGTQHGWAIRKEGDRLLSGAPERVPCAERDGFVHIMLDA